MNISHYEMCIVSWLLSWLLWNHVLIYLLIKLDVAALECWSWLNSCDFHWLVVVFILQYLLPRTLDLDGEVSGQRDQDRSYWISKVGDVSGCDIVFSWLLLNCDTPLHTVFLNIDTGHTPGCFTCSCLISGKHSSADGRRDAIFFTQ